MDTPVVLLARHGNPTERWLPMLALFDIFVLQQDGSLRWCEPAETLEAAKVRVGELAQSAQGRYVIFDQQTGQSVVIDTSSLESAASG
jgi:hypothetical protein